MAVTRKKGDQGELFGPVPVGKILPVLPPSRIKRRLIESSAAIETDERQNIAYQHTVFCQTGLPYRDPGPEVREWERRQGSVALKVQAGEAMNPETGNWVKVGLPWGTKPRLILTHLNSQALKQGSPVIEVEESLSAFVKRIRGFNGGREIRMFKEQLSCLSASLIRMAMTRGDRAFQIDTKVVTSFDLWLAKDDRQRVLWPSIVQLSLDYFENLQKHAVPLDERAIAALSHSALGLDTYAWLAQRLHRIEAGKPQFIPWTALKAQFGADYNRMDNFKRKFREVLRAVLTQYRAARIEMDDRGMMLWSSPPPIKGRIVLVNQALKPNRLQ